MHLNYYIDVAGAGAIDEIADLIRQLEIDIVVDLTGFTGDNRLGVFARRPAPIQVNYLGYPGTIGASYIDYILADPTVIPEDHREFYAEQVVWLPESYHVNDKQRPIPRTRQRAVNAVCRTLPLCFVVSTIPIRSRPRFSISG